jgi:hypothetical protein
MNCTMPANAGPPFCAGVIVAVKVTLDPCVAVLLDDETEVVVLMKTTVWDVVPKELAKLVSPEYFAVIMLVPPGTEDVVNVNGPAPETGNDPSKISSEKNCTVPVIAGAPG